MIGEDCLEKLLEMINCFPRLTLEVTLYSSDEHLIGVTGFLVIVTPLLSQLVVTATHWGHHFSPLLSLLALLFAPMPIILTGTPRPPPRATFPLSRMKMALTTSSLEACLVAMLSSSFMVFG
jgi:hypothetical protein